MTQQYPPQPPPPPHGPDPRQWQGYGQTPPTAKKQKRKWPWVVGAFLLLFSFARGGDDGAPTSTPQVAAAAAPAAAPVVPAAPQEYCATDPEPWTAGGSCVSGGEVVTVQTVIDADTLRLADGRTVRLLAVDAPMLDDCAGAGAVAFTRGKLSGKPVKLIAEPGTDVDENGNLWRYVTYSENPDRRTGLPVFADDLGQDLVSAGWAKPVSGGENAEYMRHLTWSADSASYQPEGMYASPCGKPKVYGDDDGNGVADYEEDVDVNVNAPNVNLPDGALTGGFCARKWWC